MLIKELISNREPPVIGPRARLIRAAALMAQHDLPALPVGTGRHLIGVLTDHDIVTEAIANERNLKDTLVADIMGFQFDYCYDHQDTETVARKAVRPGIEWLMVVDSANRVVGLLSAAELRGGPESPGAGPIRTQTGNINFEPDVSGAVGSIASVRGSTASGVKDG